MHIPKFINASGKVLKSFSELSIEDVIQSLTHTNRFNGLCKRQISVAMHTLHCLDIYRAITPQWELDKALEINILFHDVPEVYTGDIPTYIKNLLETETGFEFSSVLEEIEFKILDHFNVPLTSKHDLLKQIDLTALALEAEFAFDSYDKEHWSKIDKVYNRTDLISFLYYNEQIDYHFRKEFSDVMENNKCLSLFQLSSSSLFSSQQKQ